MNVESLVCNKAELAERLKCSLPTLDAWLRGDPDFPVKQRGSNGVAWQFVLTDVIAYLRRQDEEAQRAIDERKSLFEQFRLPLDEIASPEAEGLTPQQRAALALARQREHDLALAAGQVVMASDMREAYRRVFRAFGRFFDGMPAQLGRMHNLPDPVVRSIRAQVDEQRRNLVRDLGDELRAEAEPQRELEHA